MTMKITRQNATIELTLGDITDQTVDVIVNAANASLAGGGGVDGAIHRRGGPSIMAETQQNLPNGCPTGEAVITYAGNLNAKYVIHAVAPRYRPDDPRVPELLASAYRNSLVWAAELNSESIAFPSLGTGTYRYPLNEAATIALTTVRDFLDTAPDQPLRLIRFVLFDATTLAAFEDAASEVFTSSD